MKESDMAIDHIQSLSIHSDSEAATDFLIELVAEREAARAGSPMARHVESLEAIARETAANAGLAQRARVERIADDFIRRKMPRIIARSNRVRELPGDPALRPADFYASVSRCLVLAPEVTPYVDLAVAAGTGRELWDVVCEDWVELPREIKDGRHIAVKVAGDSMTPLLHPGDVLLLKLGRTIERDTVVVARVPEEGYVVKRVGYVDRERITLVSLNAAFPDVDIPARDDLILGTLVARWCSHN